MNHTSSSFSSSATGAAPLKIRVAADIGDFSTFWPRSNALRNTSCHAFQCADVLEVWLRTIGAARGTKPFFAVIDNDAGAPWLGLPLGIERQRGVRVLTFLDGGVSDYNAPVIFNTAPLAQMPKAHEIIDALTTILPAFDIIRFDKMPEQVGDHANPLIAEGSSPVAPSGYVVSLDHDWKTYSDTRLPRKRDTLRKRRKLESMGELRFVIAATSEEKQQILNAMIEQKTARYVETRGWNGFDRPGYRAYYPAMTQALGENIHLSALKLDDTFLAAHWGLHLGQRYYELMPSFDQSWQKLSPGRILTEHLLQWSFENHKKWFDMGIGDEAYKQEYCDIVLPLHQLVIGQTARGRLFLLASERFNHFKSTRAGQWLKSSLRKLMPNLGRPA